MITETKEERVTRILRYMEHLLMSAMEAETKKQAQAMMREYVALWNSIRDDLPNARAL